MARGKTGRKRQSGERYKSGKLRPTIDKGCDGVIRRQHLYGIHAPANDGSLVLVDATQTFDAIGRAWSAGLILHPGKDSAALRDAGRDTAALYWRAYGLSPRDSLAKFMEGMGSNTDPSARERALEDALNRRLDAINSLGRNVRSAFDALCIDFNPDHGPMWLDALIWAKRRGRAAEPRDEGMLRLALQGLAELV